MSRIAFGTRAGAWILAFVFVCGALACGGSSFDGRTYTSGDMRFRVGPIPKSWRSVSSDTALLAFRDDPNEATIAVSGRCGKDGDDVPLQALTHHLFLHFTDRQVLSQSTVPLAGREALRTEIIAKLDGVAKHFLVYVLKKDGCVYDFMYISGAARAVVGGEFDTFVRGFATLNEP